MIENNSDRYIKLFYIEKMVQSHNRGRYLIVEQTGYAKSTISVESFGFRCSIGSLNHPAMECYPDGTTMFYTRGNVVYRNFKVIDVPFYIKSFISIQRLVDAYNGRFVRNSGFIDRKYGYLNTYTIE